MLLQGRSPSASQASLSRGVTKVGEVSQKPARTETGGHTRPAAFFEVRPTALAALSSFLASEGPHLSPQELSNLFQLTNISGDFLPQLLRRYQAKYAHAPATAFPQPRMVIRHRTDQVMRTLLPDKYKDISAGVFVCVCGYEAILRVWGLYLTRICDTEC